LGGHDWLGLRNLGGIEGLEEAADMSAQQMKFTLSGVDAATLALAIGEDRDEYVGRIVTVWLQFFDANWQPVAVVQSHVQPASWTVSRFPVRATATRTSRTRCAF
jgi:hypothetical protein